MRWICPLLLVGACSAPLRMQVEMSRNELQQRLQQRFPVEESVGFVRLVLDDPQVLLEEGSEEIGLSVAATLQLGPIEIPAGRAGVTGRLSYEPESGFILLYEPKVHSLDLRAVPSEHRETAERVITQTLEEVVPLVPLYRVEGSDKWMLKSARVTDGRLVVEVGL